MEISQKSRKKLPSFEILKSTLAEMTLSCNYYAHRVQTLDKVFLANSGSKSARMAKLQQFSQGHPKPSFS